MLRFCAVILALSVQPALALVKCENPERSASGKSAYVCEKVLADGRQCFEQLSVHFKILKSGKSIGSTPRAKSMKELLADYQREFKIVEQIMRRWYEKDSRCNDDWGEISVLSEDFIDHMDELKAGFKSR